MTQFEKMDQSWIPGEQSDFVLDEGISKIR